MIALPKSDYDQLLAELDSFDENKLSAKAKELGLITVPVGDFEEMSRKVAKPTINEVEQLAKSMDMMVLSTKEHSSLLSSLDNPSKDYILTKSEGLGLKTITLEDYKELNNVSAEKLTYQATTLGLSIVESTKLNELELAASRISLDDATTEQLISSLSNSGYVSVLEDDLESLKNPGVKEIISAAEKNGMLKYSIELDILLITFTIGLSAIPKDDYEKLLDQVDNFDAEKLHFNAEKLGHIALPTTDHRELVRKANEPTENELKSLAESSGLEVVPAIEYKRLVTSLEEPSKDYIISKSSSLGLKVISQDEYDTLNDSSPERLATLASSQGMYVIELEKYNQLSRDLSKEDVIQKASNYDLTAIPTVQYAELINPTKEKINSKANEIGCTVISLDEYKLLQDFEIAEAKEKEQGLIKISSTDYEELKRQAETPSEEELKHKLSAIGLVGISTAALAELQRKRTEEEVHEDAKTYGLVAVPESELKSLRKPSASFITAAAAGLGLVTLSSSEHKKISEPSLSDIQSKLSSHGMVSMSTDKYQQLLKPTADDLRKSANSLGLGVIPVAELDDLREKASNNSPEILQEHAQKLGYMVIPSNPSVEVLNNLASKKNLQIVDKSHLDHLEHISSNPTKDELVGLAALQGSTVIAISELQSLHKQIDEPSLDALKSYGKKMNVSIISDNELNELQRKATKPTQQELIEDSASLGLSLIPSEELEELNRKLTEPTITELSELSRSAGFVALSAIEYEQLEKNAVEPDQEQVLHHCKRLGLSGISLAELEELTKKINQPSKTDLEASAKKLNLVLVPRDQFASMNEKSLQLEKIMSEESDSPRKQLGSVLARKEHFEGIIRKSAYTESSSTHGEKVMDSMRSLGYVPLSSEEYKRLVDNQQEYKPTKLDVVRSAKEFGLVALAADEYKTLIKRGKSGHGKSNSVTSLDGFDEKSRSGSPFQSTPVLLPQDFNLSRSSSVNDNLRSLESVPSDYLASLRRIAETPTSEDVMKLARKVGLVCAVPGVATDSPNLVAITKEQYERYVPESVSIPIKPLDLTTKDAFSPSISRVGTPLSLAKSTVPLPTSAFEQSSDLTQIPVSRSITPLPTEALVGSQEPISEGESAAKDVSDTKESITLRASAMGLALVGATELVSLRNSEKNSLAFSNEKDRLQNELQKTKALSESLTKEKDHIKNELESKSTLVKSLEDEKAELTKNIEKLQDEIAGYSTALEAEKSKAELKLRELAQDNTRLHEEKASLVKEHENALTTHADAITAATVALEESKNDKSETLERKNRELELVSQAHADNDTALESLKAQFEKVSAEKEGLEEDILSNKEAIQDAEASLKLSKQSIDELHSENLKLVDEIKRLEALIESDNMDSTSQSDGSIDPDTILTVNETGVEPLVLTNKSFENEKQEGPFTLEESKSEIAKLKTERDELLSKVNAEPTIDSVKTSAGLLGLTVLPHEVFSSLNRNAADATRPREYTVKEIQAIARKLGYSVVPDGEKTQDGQDTRSRSPSMVPLIIPNSRRTSASSLVTPRSPSSAPSVGSISTENINNEAAKRGLVLISQKEHSLLKERESVYGGEVSEEELRKQALSRGMHLLTPEDYDDLKSSPAVRVINESSLKSDAERLGFNVLSSTEFSNYLELRNAKVVGPTEFKHDENGFVRVPVVVYNKLSSDSVLTKEKIKSEAENVGLAVLPVEEYNLWKKQRTNSAELPVLREVHVGKMAGSSSEFEESNRWSATVHTPRVSEIYSVSSHGLPTQQQNGNENSNPFVAGSSSKSLMPPPVLRSPGARSSEGPMLDSAFKPDLRLRDANSPVSASVMGMSAMTVGTNISFNDRHIVSIVTQVLVGEYLYKYTRRLALSGISDNRHERFFWVHPYTMTLYWSADNHTVDFRHNGRAKSIPILGVRQEEDANPLPVGLFHKSIIVQSSERVVKITCSTRQRHNIWYSALLYLLKRTDELPELEEESDGLNPYVNENRIDQERIRAHNSPSRPMSRITSLRHSIAPEMNRSRSGRTMSSTRLASSSRPRRSSTLASDARSVASHSSDVNSPLLDKFLGSRNSSRRRE